jgi:hypothetical protein
MNLHHTGFVVRNIDAYILNVPDTSLIRRVFDPVQDAELAIFKHANQPVLLELIAPSGEKSFTYNFLQRNGEAFHHFCYRVSSHDEAALLASQYRLIRVLGPVPAILFDSAEVLFYFNRNKQIIEFLIQPNEDNSNF